MFGFLSKQRLLLLFSSQRPISPLVLPMLLLASGKIGNATNVDTLDTTANLHNHSWLGYCDYMLTSWCWFLEIFFKEFCAKSGLFCLLTKYPLPLQMSLSTFLLVILFVFFLLPFLTLKTFQENQVITWYGQNMTIWIWSFVPHFYLLKAMVFFLCFSCLE